MSKRFKGKMIVRAAFGVGKTQTRVLTKEYEIGDDLTPAKLGKPLRDMLTQVLPEVSNATNVTLVVTFG